MDLVESNLVNLFKLPFKKRNQAIDALFYDVEALSREEQVSLTPWVDHKGSILVVSPSEAGQPIRHYPNALRFLLEEGAGVQAIAVAGVGSSVLGTAALARSVADNYGFDVAGIVTGYGLAEVFEEALGGWLFYSGIDRARHRVERAITDLRDAPPTSAPSAPSDVDVSALYDILTAKQRFAKPDKLRLLVGHSKGNLLIRFVLEHMKRQRDRKERGAPRTDPCGNIPPLEDLAVVTLGTVVDVPDSVVAPRNVYQFLGSLDWLGAMNSGRDPDTVVILPHTTVPGSGHHLNPRLPGALPIAELLRVVGCRADPKRKAVNEPDPLPA